jgi:hypothetical protein
MAQRYKSRWVKVGDATITPALVVKTLITRGRTVLKKDDQGLLKMSEWLFENGGEQAINKIIKEFDSNNYKYTK